LSEFNIVIWEGTEEDGGDELRLLYNRELDLVALQDVGHGATVYLEPAAMLRLSSAFLAWSEGLSSN
jgi:hypothetical protein